MKNNPYFEELFQGFNKEQAFDQLAELFYDRNFSTATKAEVDLLMFSFYLDAMLAKHKDPTTGVIDFKECSDYNIAQHLGITQERVKSLKIKKQIRYPVKYEWEKAFEALKDSIRYDQQKKRIVIPVPDPNLYLDIKKCIEDSGGYIEVQRSTKFDYDNGDYVFVPGIRDAIKNGKEEIPAKVIAKDGVHDITLFVKGLTDEEKQIILDGCLMNYYKNRH